MQLPHYTALDQAQAWQHGEALRQRSRNCQDDFQLRIRTQDRGRGCRAIFCRWYGKIASTQSILCTPELLCTYPAVCKSILLSTVSELVAKHQRGLNNRWVWERKRYLTFLGAVGHREYRLRREEGRKEVGGDMVIKRVIDTLHWSTQEGIFDWLQTDLCDLFLLPSHQYAYVIYRDFFRHIISYHITPL